MYHYSVANEAKELTCKTGGKSITELVLDHEDDPILDGIPGKKFKIKKGDSVWTLRVSAGWPNYKNNVTDGLIINYLKKSTRYKGVFDSNGIVLKDTEINIPQYKEYLDARKNIGGTALIIYGHGASSPVANNNLGTTLKDNAVEKQRQLKESGNYNAVLVVECYTEKELLTAVNTTYPSGLISRLEVFTHASDNSIILGDRYDENDKAYDKYEDDSGQYRNDDAAKDRRMLSKDAGEISSIKKTNFSKDCRVILWGCRQAGGDYKKSTSSHHGYSLVPVTSSFAQGLADHLKVPVQAFYNTSRAPEKTVEGKKQTYVAGRMAPEKNAKEIMVMPQGN